MDVKIYVFYKLAKKGEWVYHDLPFGWKAYRQTHMDELNILYEQKFTGFDETDDEVFEYLNQYFEYLKKDGIVENYKFFSDKRNKTESYHHVKSSM